jgi:glycosyltransferase involved in cell wall biosynthesis
MNKILIVVPTFNREKISKACLQQLFRTKGVGNTLVVVDDQSTEYDPRVAFNTCCDNIITASQKLNIDMLRCFNYELFLQNKSCQEFDYLYLTDNDAFHSPQWLSVLEAAYNKYKLPVCLYNTKCHRLGQDTLEGDYILSPSAPGISQFFDRATVEKIYNGIKAGGARALTCWDYRSIEFAGGQAVTTATSYVEHYGANGLHNADFYTDVATTPTPWLASKRPALLDYFIYGKELPEDFYTSDSSVKV